MLVGVVVPRGGATEYLVGEGAQHQGRWVGRPMHGAGARAIGPWTRGPGSKSSWLGYTQPRAQGPLCECPWALHCIRDRSPTPPTHTQLESDQIQLTRGMSILAHGLSLQGQSCCRNLPCLSELVQDAKVSLIRGRTSNKTPSFLKGRCEFLFLCY